MATNDGFIATFGWEQPGALQRSRNGVNWEPAFQGTNYIGDIASDGTRILAGGRPESKISTDFGFNWTDVTEVSLTVWNIRRVGYTSYGGGRFIMVAWTAPDTEVAISKDGGMTWENIVAACGGCNRKKGGRTPKQANMHLASVPKRPEGLLAKYALNIGTKPHESWLDFLSWGSKESLQVQMERMRKR